MKRTAALSLVFIVGCVAGATTANLVVPPVRAGTNPTRWEYHCTEGPRSQEDMTLLGMEGWELTTMMSRGGLASNIVTCFKRPLP